jgi:hypothetical protein
MKRSIETTLLCTYVLGICVFLFLTIGNGIITKEKTTFEGVSSDGEIMVKFEGVYLDRIVGQPVKTNVALFPNIDDRSWIEIKIDEKLEATLISVYPEFSQRLFRPYSYASAKKVIVWVSSEQERKSWEKWARKVESDYWDDIRKKTAKPTAKKITPTI